MFCIKCSYTSFDHLQKCPKCGFDWSEERSRLNLDWMQAGENTWLGLGLGDEEPGADEGANVQEMGIFEAEEAGREPQYGPGVSSGEVGNNVAETDQGYPDFSLDLGSELEPDQAAEVQEKEKKTQYPGNEEIEFPDLDFRDSGQQDK